ncbi:MFS transporter [Actinomyces minihominis]|uniref:MFS transporter n=1 Tax=Actinomyces minihominis TaxID=2002838 RepID=UPI000C0788E2|nr:MFS transporter [Actinomyces minihominis]
MSNTQTPPEEVGGPTGSILARDGISGPPKLADIESALEVVEAAPKASRSKIISWASWDWGSAAFNAVATSFVFTVYLTSDGMFTDKATANQYLSWGMTAAGIIIALLAPITGQRADRAGKGVRMLGIFSFLVFISLALMFFVTPDSPLGPIGALWLGIGLLGIGNVFFEFGSVNYNAMLNDLSTPKNRGAISGFGWGAGYIGGIVLLLFLYFGFINPEVGLFGVTGEGGLDVRVAMAFAALWFGIFAIPVLINPPKRKPIDHSVPRESIADSYRHLFETVASLWRDNRNTLRFLIASAVFRDGLAGVFTFGGVIAGSVFGFTAGEVIIFAVAANVVAGLATMAFGPLDDRWGSRRIIMISLCLMIVAGLGVFFLAKYGATAFWVLGLVLTIFVGPVQSASRTFLANVIPAGREGEIFGLYATTGRAVSFLAPLLYGLAITIGTKVLPEGQDATHWGILGIVVVIVLGLLLMLPVKSEKHMIGEAAK